jgi:hypothetical protein
MPSVNWAVAAAVAEALVRLLLRSGLPPLRDGGRSTNATGHSR